MTDSTTKQLISAAKKMLETIERWRDFPITDKSKISEAQRVETELAKAVAEAEAELR